LQGNRLTIVASGEFFTKANLQVDLTLSISVAVHISAPTIKNPILYRLKRL